MITVLLAPSENKKTGGISSLMHDDTLLFGLKSREKILNAYRKLITEGNTQTLQTLFGLKKPEEISTYINDVLTGPVMPAIERYDGVAFDNLDYVSLDPHAQTYIHHHVIIFSNLFGVVRSNDLIPNYKVKQGSRIADIAPERFYKDAYSDSLDTLLADTEILDLRAGFYDKFYRPEHFVTTMKFIKNGKVVSHWAKAYRGKLLRHQAIHRFETIEALLASEIEGLCIEEVILKRQKKEIVYRITE